MRPALVEPATVLTVPSPFISGPSPQLHDRALQLQLAIQRMANIKEYRTPQVRRVSNNLQGSG